MPARVFGRVKRDIMRFAIQFANLRSRIRRCFIPARPDVQPPGYPRDPAAPQSFNDHLKAFAYIAAHDLQVPLRQVSNCAQRLATRYNGRLDADADECIAGAVDGAQRMQHLIRDLLAYCRVGTSGAPFDEISAQTGFCLACQNLSQAILESGTSITCDPLPIILADSAQLRQLFENLIGNAIKHCASRTPLIHVEATRDSEREWVFSVRDNGIGIDPRHFTRIFLMFERLPADQECSGIGTGLTVCKKIVERHGGQLWVESASGKGSTFYFTLSGNS